jgi:hypothetical protein
VLFQDNFAHVYFNRSKLNPNGFTKGNKWTGLAYLQGREGHIPAVVDAESLPWPTPDELFPAGVGETLLAQMLTALDGVQARGPRGATSATTRVSPLCSFPVDAYGNEDTKFLKHAPHAQTFDMHEDDVSMNAGFLKSLEKMCASHHAAVGVEQQHGVLYDSGNFWRLWKLYCADTDLHRPNLTWMKVLFAPWHLYKEASLVAWNTGYQIFSKKIWWHLYPAVSWRAKPDFSTLTQLLGLVALATLPTQFTDALQDACNADRSNSRLHLFREWLLICIPSVCHRCPTL